MFKFNFAAAEPSGEHKEQSPKEEAKPSAAAEEVSADEARYLGLHDVVRVGMDITLLKGQVSNAQAASLLGQTEVTDSDLLPGQYEGGFKVWEGSVDLAEYVAMLWLADGRANQAVAGARSSDQQPGATLDQSPAASYANQQAERGNAAGFGSFAGCGGAAAAAAAGAAAQRLLGQRVIELGCGHALPGLIALMAGAEVHFQDYNREVVQTVTIPNVAANWGAWQFRLSAPTAGAGAAASGARSSSTPPTRYFCGDWGGLGEVLEARGLAGAYDVVLSAETIYSLDSTRSLYQCIKQCLKRPAGVAYVAAKSYYFGVGGGTAEFVRLVNGEGLMRARVVAVVDDGVSNKRDIIQLTYA